MFADTRELRRAGEGGVAMGMRRTEAVLSKQLWEPVFSRRVQD